MIFQKTIQVTTYAQKPVDRKIQSFFDSQEVNEWPQNCSNEVDDNHEQKEVWRSFVRRWR